MSLHHLQTPAADPVKAEIAAADEALSWVNAMWPRPANWQAMWKGAHERLRDAREQDYETMVADRAHHVRRIAEYESAGNTFGADETRGYLARCDAALARLAPADRIAA